MSQLPFAFRLGRPASTGMRIVIWSLVAGSASVFINNIKTDVVMESKLSGLYYRGVHDVNNLSADTVYSLSISQNNYTLTSTPKTLPNADKNIKSAFVSCDSGSDGMYPVLNKQDIDLVTHIDDNLYADIETVDDTTGTGLSTGGVVGVVQTEAAYSICYLAMLGLLADNSTSSTAGRSPHRQWSYQNRLYLCQLGDHEFKNGFEQVGNTNETIRVNAGNAWDNFYGALSPDYLDPTHRAWVSTIGSVQFISPDRCSLADSSISNGTPSFYGATQIQDILNATDSSWLKIMCNANGLRNMLPPTFGWTPDELGDQDQLFDSNQNEFEDLYVHDGSLTAKGLMKQVIDDGTKLVCCHGDKHHAMAKTFRKQASGTNVTEEFMQIFSGSLTGTANHRLHPDIVTGFRGNDCECVWLPDLNNILQVASAPKYSHMWFLIIDMHNETAERYADFNVLFEDETHVMGWRISENQTGNMPTSLSAVNSTVNAKTLDA